MKTPMQLFGSEAPPGWDALIKPLIEQAEEEGLPIFQIKAKFGMLRFYVDGASTSLIDAIEKAERASAITCEQCGKPARLCVNESGTWVRTLCEFHARAFHYALAR